MCNQNSGGAKTVGRIVGIPKKAHVCLSGGYLIRKILDTLLYVHNKIKGILKTYSPVN